MFLSTPPSRVATDSSTLSLLRLAVSIHATLAGGDAVAVGVTSAEDRVSIHATLAGGDRRGRRCWIRSRSVSIHATLAGGDDLDHFRLNRGKGFLSTPPSRVATDSAETGTIDIAVSIHATLAGGDEPPRVRHRGAHIVSIHATLAGGDTKPKRRPATPTSFLSTPPSRVATANWNICRNSSTSFYPRHPRGWRPGHSAAT